MQCLPGLDSRDWASPKELPRTVTELKEAGVGNATFILVYTSICWSDGPEASSTVDCPETLQSRSCSSNDTLQPRNTRYSTKC